jgi:hypothetical protein
MATETAAGVPLTDVERRLVDHVIRGEPLDLAGGEPVDEAGMRSWDRDSSRTIQAAVLRDILRGRLAPDPDPHGLRLRGARIAGRLDLENVTTGVAVELKDCLLGEGLVARDATLRCLSLSGCRLEGPYQSPLDADRLSATMLVLDHAVITAACETGAIQLLNAHLGILACSHATIRNDSGPALAADGLQVDHAVYLRTAEAVGAGEFGAVRLVDAHIHGQLDCEDTTIRNDTGPALNADSLQVDQGLYLRVNFLAVGAGEPGAVRLPGAHIGGDLDCTGGTLRNGTGPALVATGLQVDQGVFLAGTAWVADDPTIRQGVFATVFEAVGGGRLVTLNLREMRIGGELVFAPTRIEHSAGPQARLVLDGLTHVGLPLGISLEDWLRLLREGTRSYAPQPYQQLAAAYRSAGHDDKVRRILIAQRQDQIDPNHGVPTGRGERAWARLTGLTLGYGYQPWRALLFLIAVATTAVVLALTLGAC